MIAATNMRLVHSFGYALVQRGAVSDLTYGTSVGINMKLVKHALELTNDGFRIEHNRVSADNISFSITLGNR